MLTEEFKETYAKHALQFENEKFKIYEDSNKVPTIGVGFALINRTGNTWKAYDKDFYTTHGIDLNDKQYAVIKEYAELKSKKKTIPHDLTTKLKNMNVTITKETSKDLFNYSVKDKYSLIESKIGEHWNKMNLARQIGVMDHCFQIGNIKELKDSLLAEDYVKTANIIRSKGKNKPYKDRAELRADFVKFAKMEFKGIYIVHRGDTVSGIAKSNKLSLKELVKLNPELKDTNKLSVGRTINIVPTKLQIIHIKCNQPENQALGSFALRLIVNEEVTIGIAQYFKKSDLLLSNPNQNDEKKIISDYMLLQEANRNKSIHFKTLNITARQYNRILDHIEQIMKMDNVINATDNITKYCAVESVSNADFVQEMYNATGLPLYFTTVYSVKELQDLDSADANKAIKYYGSSDNIISKLSNVKGDCKEDVASMLNVDCEQVHALSSFLGGCIPSKNGFRVEVTESVLEMIRAIIDNPVTVGTQAHLIKDLEEIFLSKKIPPEILDNPADTNEETKDIVATKNTNESFIILKKNVIESLDKSKVEFDKLLVNIDQQALGKAASFYTQKQLIEIYEKKFSELQEEFKSSHITPDGFAKPDVFTPQAKGDFNRKVEELNLWLSKELAKIPGTPQYIEASNSSSNNKINEQYSKAIQDWNNEIEVLRSKSEFNDKIHITLISPKSASELIDNEMKIFLQRIKS